MTREQSKKRFNDAVMRLAKKNMAHAYEKFGPLSDGEAAAIFERAVLPRTIVKFGHRLAHRMLVKQ